MLTSSNLQPEAITDLLERMTRLEAEVFKIKPEIAVDKKTDSIPSSVIQETEASDLSWATVFSEFAKRVDQCASQDSMAECIKSMKQLRQDFSELSIQIGSSKVSRTDFGVMEPFMKHAAPASSIVRFTNKQSEPRMSEGRSSSGEGRSFSFLRKPTTGKKWGPCFYCSLKEWMPGHTCEGARQAQLRKKEREINRVSN